MKVIDDFSGEYAFLSNFYPAQINYKGMDYATTEHAYQAQKFLDKSDQLKIRNAGSPGNAKRLAKQFKKQGKVRDNWFDMNLEVMLDVLRLKFAIPELKQKLLDTGDAKLIEGNYWHDYFFGVCNGRGQNHLGRLLMKVREEIKHGETI